MNEQFDMEELIKLLQFQSPEKATSDLISPQLQQGLLDSGDAQQNLQAVAQGGNSLAESLGQQGLSESNAAAQAGQQRAAQMQAQNQQAVQQAQAQKQQGLSNLLGIGMSFLPGGQLRKLLGGAMR